MEKSKIIIIGANNLGTSVKRLVNDRGIHLQVVNGPSKIRESVLIGPQLVSKFESPLPETRKQRRAKRKKKR